MAMLGKLDVAQNEALIEFCDNVKPLLDKPEQDLHFLLRFLQANNFDLAKATELLRESIRFRRLWRLGDDLCDWDPPEVLKSYFPGGWLPGCDKEGHPIRVEPIGRVDIPGIIKSCQYSDLIKFHASISEQGLALCRNFGNKQRKYLHSFTLIIDLQGLGLDFMWKPGINTYSEMINIQEKNYPELFNNIFIINPPMFFSQIFNVIKPFIHNSTDKITILKDDYKEVLRKYIPVENIPACYGGKLVDTNGDEHCRQWITYGGEVPKHYYLSDSGSVISAMKSKNPPLNLLLDEFKKRICDIIQNDQIDDDNNYMTWLKCYDFDLIKAEEMFRRNLEFKQRWRLDDTIIQWIPPLVLQKYFPGGWLPGVDIEGHPVRVEPLGNIDLRGLMHSCTFNDLLRYFVKVAEENAHRCKLLSLQAGRTIEGYTLIVDLKGLNRSFLWGPGITIFNEMISTIANNYPTGLKTIYLIRCPPIFPTIYNLCKAFLGRDTTKVKLLGNDYKEVLLKTVGKNSLPRYYGGNLTDSAGDEKCSEWVCYGGEVPHSYYINQNASLQDDLNWQNVIISAGISFKAEYPVDIKGSIIRWRFRCKKHDIGFGIYFKKNLKFTSLQNMKNIIPVERHSCRIIPERGSLYCEEVGIYALVFDNSYSYFNWKDISYQIEIIEPNSMEESGSKVTSGNIISNNES